MNIDASIYRSVMTDSDIEALIARNAERRNAAIQALGSRWLGWAQKKEAPAPEFVNPKVSQLKRKAAK